MKKLIRKNVGDDERGFSILEVLVAMGIFSIGVLALVSLQITALTRSASAVKNSQAEFWAVDAAESLMRLPYDDADLDTISTLGGNPLPSNTEGPYTVTWAVFSSVENGTSVSADYGAYAGTDIFQTTDTTHTIDNIGPNTKLVMVHVTHPTGEDARLVFLKPNI